MLQEDDDTLVGLPSRETFEELVAEMSMHACIQHMWERLPGSKDGSVLAMDVVDFFRKDDEDRIGDPEHQHGVSLDEMVWPDLCLLVSCLQPCSHT